MGGGAEQIESTGSWKQSVNNDPFDRCEMRKFVIYNGGKKQCFEFYFIVSATYKAPLLARLSQSYLM